MSKENILYHAMRMATRGHYRKITRDALAKAAGVASGTVSYYYSIPQLRNAIMREAVEFEIVAVVAQGLADKHRIARGAPQALKDRAAKLLTA
jgi:hypothetical protein